MSVSKSVFEVSLAILIPIAGAMGYVHGTFATKTSVEKNSKRILRIDNLMCKMAIASNIRNAENICTDN